MRDSISAQFGNQRVNRDQAAAIPYASMGWRLDNGNQSIIVLATDKAGEQLWTSAMRIVLVTRDGRLVRSVGLGRDLGGSSPRAGTSLPSPAAALQGPFVTRRLTDYPDIGRYAIDVDCRSHAVNRQTITILGRAIPTMRVDEDCKSVALRWRFTDSYWVNPEDSLVWRSRQHIHPNAPTIETELFRPPG